MEVRKGRVGEEKSEGKGKGGGRRTTSRFLSNCVNCFREYNTKHCLQTRSCL